MTTRKKYLPLNFGLESIKLLSINSLILVWVHASDSFGLTFLGMNGIENILNSSIKRKDFFIKNISKNKFDIYSGPLHIVSFLPKKLEPKDSDAWTQTKVNELIKNNFMLSRPKFKGKYFLRVVMGNYNTKESHIEELLRLLDA